MPPTPAGPWARRCRRGDVNSTNEVAGVITAIGSLFALRAYPPPASGRRARVAPFPVGLFFRPVPYAGVASLGLTSAPIPRVSSGDGGTDSPYDIRTRARPPCPSRLRTYRRLSSTPSGGGARPFPRHSRPGHPRHHVVHSTRSRPGGCTRSPVSRCRRPRPGKSTPSTDSRTRRRSP